MSKEKVVGAEEQAFEEKLREKKIAEYKAFTEAFDDARAVADKYLSERNGLARDVKGAEESMKHPGRKFIKAGITLLFHGLFTALKARPSDERARDQLSIVQWFFEAVDNIDDLKKRHKEASSSLTKAENKVKEADKDLESFKHLNKELVKELEGKTNAEEDEEDDYNSGNEPD